MKASVVEINALPSLLFRMFSTSHVIVSEANGIVQVEPATEKSDCTIGLRGMLSDCPEMSVDKFLARMRKDAELDR